MKITSKIAGAALAVLALGGAGIGTAVAASHAPATTYVARGEPTGPDTDAVQQGDQTSPDLTGTAAAKAAPAVSSTHRGEPGTEGESSGPSDGPGGHVDPSGDVQHEFVGEE